MLSLEWAHTASFLISKNMAALWRFTTMLWGLLMCRNWGNIECWQFISVNLVMKFLWLFGWTDCSFPKWDAKIRNCPKEFEVWKLKVFSFYLHLFLWHLNFETTTKWVNQVSCGERNRFKTMNGDREKNILDDGNTDDKGTQITTFTPTRLVEVRVKFSGILWENFKLEVILMNFVWILVDKSFTWKKVNL